MAVVVHVVDFALHELLTRGLERSEDSAQIRDDLKGLTSIEFGQSERNPRAAGRGTDSGESIGDHPRGAV